MLERGNRSVIRRVGGLEDSHEPMKIATTVIRRVGGLEGAVADVPAGVGVIRRVGGLEVLGLFCACP